MSYGLTPLTFDLVCHYYAPRSAELHKERSLFAFQLSPGLWFVCFKVSTIGSECGFWNFADCLSDTLRCEAELYELIRNAQAGIAVIGIKHFNKDSEKGAMYRSSGSIGYVAVARAVWVFVADKEDESRTLMLMVKSNLGPKMDGLAFKIAKRKDAIGARIEWLGPANISAEDALSSQPGPKGVLG